MTNSLTAAARGVSAATLLALLSACATYGIPPVTEPSDEWRTGHAVWMDLVTNDPFTARLFYASVFGWQFDEFPEAGYSEIRLNNRAIGGIMSYDDDVELETSEWLVSFSVADVDASAKAAAEAGGEVLDGPADLPRRGRYAVIADPDGALFVALRTTRGDPAAAPPQINGWSWVELWTPNPERAPAFYDTLADYGALTLQDDQGETYRALAIGDSPRAGIVPMPTPWEDVRATWIPYIAVDDLPATIREALTANGRVVIPPTREFDNGTVAILADSVGGVFAIHQQETN